MRIYSDDEVDFVRQKNLEFIKACALMDANGTYSSQEIGWYESMLKEIEEKIASHQEKRRGMTEEISTRCSTKRENIFNKFKDAQLEAVDEFSAKEASGKIFGRPRRAAQEIVRSELTMCMNVASVIGSLSENLKEEIEKFRAKFENIKENTEGSEKYLDELSKELRFKLMSLRSCVYFYGVY